MKLLRVPLLLLLLSLGCSKLISEHVIQSSVVTQSVDCNKLAYCITCLPGLNGKMDCAYKFSPFCPGSQKAQVRIDLIESLYQRHDGTRYTETTERQTILKTLTECE